MRQFTIFDEDDIAKLVNDQLVVVYYNGVKQIYCSEKAYKEIYGDDSASDIFPIDETPSEPAWDSYDRLVAAGL